MLRYNFDAWKTMVELPSDVVADRYPDRVDSPSR
jgi:hypothetical protein